MNIDPMEYATKEDFRAITARVDRHDNRILSLEGASHKLDKELAVVQSKLDSVLDLVKGLSTTIRNSVITVVIGAVIWVIIQMGVV